MARSLREHLIYAFRPRSMPMAEVRATIIELGGKRSVDIRLYFWPKRKGATEWTRGPGITIPTRDAGELAAAARAVADATQTDRVPSKRIA